MAIWKVEVSIEKLNQRGKGSLSEHLGIEFIEFGDDYLKAKMPVDHRTIQPMGIMHGGASCALAETVGSVAANICVDPSKRYCVGLDINTSHLRMAKTPYVYGVAKPIHLGGKIQVWSVQIFDEDEKLVSQTRLTMMVLSQPL